MSNSLSRIPQHPTICSICISEIDNIDHHDIFTTQCNHSFHINCIFPWFCSNNLTCPNCRSPTLNNDNEVAYLIDNHFYDSNDLHEDLVYSLMIRDIMNIINIMFISREF